MVFIKFCGPTGRLSAYPLADLPANKAEFVRERAECVPGLRERGEGTQGDSKRLEA